jgi:hypothetical protein
MTTAIIVAAAVIVAFLAFVATRPSAFQVERAATIKAPAGKIFPILNDFHQWSTWSPWEKMDPAMKRTHSGAPSGMGAIYEWEGNKKVGKGRMEITDVAPDSRVTLKLDFLAPFEAHNTTDFTLRPAGNSTTLSWAMRGRHRFMGKVMSIFINMDKMIGKDFEAGLANIKGMAEGQ